MSTTTQIERPIKVGSKWKQITTTPNGEKLTRIVEVIGAPTLSSPVGIRIVRNDAHPHRAGKVTSIRSAELRRKYEAA